MRVRASGPHVSPDRLRGPPPPPGPAGRSGLTRRVRVPSRRRAPRPAGRLSPGTGWRGSARPQQPDSVAGVPTADRRCRR
ncbi:hypothetical protein F8271_00990 [Micromonospora sp. ALFpr18c]|nr:hypothetical protein F8271_00990 [Micromonospora sp. ALFpr18c]